MENSDFEKFQTDFGKVLKYIKYSGDKDMLHEITHESDAYKSIDNDSAILMNAVTGSKLKIKAEEGKVDMCKAIDDMRKDSWEQGKEEGITQGIAKGEELGHNEERIECIQNLMDSMKWTATQAMDALKIPLSERSKYNIPAI